MAELEIDGSFEEQWGIVKSAVKQHNSAINGNGQPGLLDFQSSIKAQLRLVLIAISVAGLILAILTYLEANRQLHSGQLHVETPVNASTQNAGSPIGPHY